MSNFSFIQDEWPSVFDDAHHAESALHFDPRTACFYARRTIEGLVGDLYWLHNLPEPYKRDLNGRLDARAFKQMTPAVILTKLNLIRKWGNVAAHGSRAIPADTALNALRELFHVIVWAALHHSTLPQEQVPTGKSFDPTLAKASAALSPEKFAQLTARLKRQDEEHARALEASEADRARLQAENAELLARIQQFQAQQAVVDDHDYDEAHTRDLYIDTLLHEAGWALDKPHDREYEVRGMPNQQGIGYVDYVLWGADGRPLAVVEAKRTRQSPVAGQEQARLYADCLQAEFGRRPVIFYTNGYEHWLWDDAGGYPPRNVHGFYTADQLAQLIGRRDRPALSDHEVDQQIAGRPYQIRAIKAVGEAFDAKQRQALLVMATGSGKTRTTIALVQQLMKAGWVKTVLFLADRKELVKQASDAFAAHLPDTTTVNLLREPRATGRVYCSTYQTMLRMVNETDDSGRRFTPGSFDLVVVDEAHRSVYGRYGFIFDYFDALLLGLTATPKDEIDHNTYRLFHLEDGVPTDAYELTDAVADGFLVPPVSVSVGTRFLRQGITYDELSDDEKDQWDALEWGEDGPPDSVGAAEINKFLFNSDTIDKVLGHLMEAGYRTHDGERIAKTIIFAKNQAHADLVLDRFDRAWPQYGGELARVITHHTTYADSLIDDFKNPNGKCRIAISVDMLDTGIDVPEVANLVFFKPVYSRTKFWQMLGRGTRLCPDLFGPGRDKQDFQLFDFCGNLEFFREDPPTREGASQKSLTQRIIETRTHIAHHLQGNADHADVHAAMVETLHEFVCGMTLDNVLVRPHRAAVERWGDREAWQTITPADLEELEALAGLPSTAAASGVDALRFDALVLNRELAQITGDLATADRLRKVLQQIAESLLTQTTIPMVLERAELLEQVADDEWWVDVTLPMLEMARKRLRDLLQFVPKKKSNRVYTDFADALIDPEVVELPAVTAGLDSKRFREKVQEYLRQHENDLALQRLRRNKQLTPEDLTALEQMLVEAGGLQTDIAWASQHEGGLGVFIRSLVGLDRAAAQEAFAEFLDDGRHSVEQIRFIGLIIEELTRNGVMEPGRLYESPYIDHAPSGPDEIFGDRDLGVIVNILDQVKKHAAPTRAS